MRLTIGAGLLRSDNVMYDSLKLLRVRGLSQLCHILRPPVRLRHTSLPRDAQSPGVRATDARTA